MSIWWVIILFLLGLALIIKGGDFFVDAATWIAEVSVVPSMITGKFARWQGITLLALYIGYIVVLSTGVLGF